MACGCRVPPFYYTRQHKRRQLRGFTYSTRWNETYSGPRAVTLQVNASTAAAGACLVQLRAVGAARVKFLGYSVQAHGRRGDSRGGVFGS